MAGLDSERPPAVVLGDLTLIRPLAMAGIPVVLATARTNDEASHSRHVRATCVLPGFEPGQRAASAERLSRLGEELQSHLGVKAPLIYGADAHLDLLYAHRAELGRHYLFRLNDEPLAGALHDKERFYQLASAAHIRVPRTCPSGPGLIRAMSGLRGPILVKPRQKGAWTEIQKSLFDGQGKARVFASRRELLAHPAFESLKDQLIVQEHIASHPGGLLSFHGFAGEDGRLQGWFCGRKLRTAPSFAGESSFIELTTDRSVEITGRDVAGKLALRGPFKIDMIRDARSGALFVLEINARFNLWHHLGAVHGVNLPAIACDYLRRGRHGEPPKAAEPRYRWIDLYRDHQAFREERREGRLTSLQWAASLASPRNVLAMFAWDDPAPSLHWAANLAARRCENGALWHRLRHSR